MGRLSSVLLKAVGLLVLALVVLSVVGTIVGIALSVIAAVLSMVLMLAVAAVFVLAAVGLVSLFGDDSTAPSDSDPKRQSQLQQDPEERLRSRYVAGELGDEEFERELERVLERDEPRGRREPNRTAGRDAAGDRRQLRDR